jgi:uncharacterized protein YdbL (DUF1318 family)
MTKAKFLLVFLSITLISCVTVNIYFPAAQAQKTAKEIVEDVRGVKVEKKEEPQSFQWLGVAYAGQAELEVSNATIRALKESIKARYPRLKPFLSSGILGESLQGYLVLKDTGGLSLRDKALVNRLMSAESRDREALYKAVAQALSIDKSLMPRLRGVFAKEWERTAPPGTWIEVKPGEWKRK